MTTSARTARRSPRRARWVRIDPDAPVEPGGVAGLDPALHYLDAAPEEIARYVLILDAINFGSGWFGTLRRPASDDTDGDDARG